jgi:hypothetical protein
MLFFKIQQLPKVKNIGLNLAILNAFLLLGGCGTPMPGASDVASITDALKAAKDVKKGLNEASKDYSKTCPESFSVNANAQKLTFDKTRSYTLTSATCGGTPSNYQVPINAKIACYGCNDYLSTTRRKDMSVSCGIQSATGGITNAVTAPAITTAKPSSGTDIFKTGGNVMLTMTLPNTFNGENIVCWIPEALS